MRASLPLAILLAAIIAAGSTRPGDVGLIDELNDCMTARFQYSSAAAHSQSLVTLKRGFQPENARERKLLTALEQQGLQVGLYLFGRTIGDRTPDLVTITKIRAASQDERLPDLTAISPVARMAMRTFAAGGKGYAATVGNWQIIARPVLVENDRCIACHGNGVALHEALGGAIYAYRRAGM
jgi:hypothetical protein